MPEPFGSLLRRFRTRSGLNLSELAEGLGASRMSIRAWEQGHRVPRDRARLEDLAQVLRLTSDEADQLADAARQHRFPRAGAALPAAVPAESATGSPGPALRHQLRAPIADFVGRTIAVESLVTTLQAALTPGSGAIISGVQGMGGIGKTELAYLVAHRLRDTFPDAQIVLDLRGSSTTPLPVEQALQMAIRAFLPDASLPDELEALQPRYRSVLHGQQALLLADDARDAAQVYALIPPAGCVLLITSRLRFSLPGMATLDLEQLNEEEAIGLLQGICGRLGKSEAQVIARACGYLPLGLRVSGSLLRNDPALSVTNYLSGLADARLRLARLRDPDDRRLDVESSLGLSYTLLDSAAQRVFRQLGVIVADFATELALAVVDANADLSTEDVLHQLLRRNLVMYDAERQRWRLHDLVRDLARRYLEMAGELEAAVWRYAHAAVRIAQQAEEHYKTGGDGALAALARFDAERPHIDTARCWAAAHTGAADGDALLVADACATRYIDELRCDMRRERLPQLETALSAARRLGDQRGEATVLNGLGCINHTLGDMNRAIHYFEQCRASTQVIGDRESEAYALGNLGNAYLVLGNPRRGIEYYEQCLTIVQLMSDRYVEGIVLGNLGAAYLNLGEVWQALAALERAHTLVCELGDRYGEEYVLINLGDAHLALGETQRAIASFEQSLTNMHALGDRRGEGEVLYHLGRAYLALGDAGQAIETCARALDLLREVDYRREEGYAQSVLGAAYAAQGDRTRAYAAFEQALALLRDVGDRHGEAACSWHYGLALAQQGERQRALPLLRATVAYQQEIGHTEAAERAALLARLEAGEESPEKVLLRTFF